MSASVHLVLILHGLWGAPSHVAYLANILAKNAISSDTQLEIFCPSSIQWTHTYDGIDFCAEIISRDLDQKLAELQQDGKTVTKFSCVGYSFGGLIARFLVGLLHSRSPSFFTTIEPMNFATFASPWIGLPNYGGVLGSTMNFFGSRLLSRTGNQLYLADKFNQYPKSPKDSPKYPLVALLAHPATNFYIALSRFKTITIYANAINDRTVPFVTGAAEKLDAFHMSKQVANKFFSSHPRLVSSDLTEVEIMKSGGLEIALDPDYPALIKKIGFVENASPSIPRPKQTSSSGPKFFTRYLPRLPFFMRPTSYPWRVPLNYLAAVFSPVVVPLFLLWVVGLLSYQSSMSRKRIKKYSVGDMSKHSERLRRIGLFEEMEQNIIEDMAGIGNKSLDGPQPGANQPLLSADRFATDDHPNSEGESLSTTGYTHTSATTDSGRGTEYSIQLTGQTSEAKLAKDHGLSPIQLEMLENINQLPGLAKYFGFFDGIPNSHGALIYRVAGLSDERGRLVGRHWAERFII